MPRFLAGVLSLLLGSASAASLNPWVQKAVDLLKYRYARVPSAMIEIVQGIDNEYAWGAVESLVNNLSGVQESQLRWAAGVHTERELRQWKITVASSHSEDELRRVSQFDD